MLVNKRKEVLRLYREILRTSRQFEWPNEQGQPWSLVLQQNARMDIERNRNEMDGDTISKHIVFGWDCLRQVQEKMVAKQEELTQQATGVKSGPGVVNKPSA